MHKWARVEHWGASNLAVSFTLVDRATAHRSWPIVAPFPLAVQGDPEGQDVVLEQCALVWDYWQCCLTVLEVEAGPGLDPWAPQKGKQVTQWWLFWALWENQNDSVWWVKRSHSWPSLWSLCFYYVLWSWHISAWLDPKGHLWSQQLTIAGVLAFRICWFDVNMLEFLMHMLEVGLLLFLLVFRLVFAGIRLPSFWLNNLQLWKSDLSLTYYMALLLPTSQPHLKL